jgi:hypothetical protein
MCDKFNSRYIEVYCILINLFEFIKFCYLSTFDSIQDGSLTRGRHKAPKVLPLVTLLLKEDLLNTAPPCPVSRLKVQVCSHIFQIFVIKVLCMNFVNRI